MWVGIKYMRCGYFNLMTEMETKLKKSNREKPFWIGCKLSCPNEFFLYDPELSLNYDEDKVVLFNIQTKAF